MDQQAITILFETAPHRRGFRCLVEARLNGTVTTFEHVDLATIDEKYPHAILATIADKLAASEPNGLTKEQFLSQRRDDIIDAVRSTAIAAAKRLSEKS